MALDSLDRAAERVMRRWVLPAYFAAASVFCLAIATYAVVDRHWLAAVVLLTVAVGLARFGDQARRTRPCRQQP
jgi:hypothetical protein